MKIFARSLAVGATLSFISGSMTPVQSAPAMAYHATGAAQADALVAQLRSKVKYVFVFAQENRSFDSYFGSYPGADGLFSEPPARTPGYSQPIINTDGTVSAITPFRIGPAQYAADLDDSDHAHSVIVSKENVTGYIPQMNRYAESEERVYSPTGNPSLQAKQFGELTMAHVDCDTIPLYWDYAKKFTLFDQIYSEFTSPSTPGNIALFAAQAGITQYIKHPSEKVSGNGDSGPGMPVLNDANPFWGSAQDMTQIDKQPYNPGDGGTPQLNLTFASVPLTLQGKSIAKLVQSDRDYVHDIADVAGDVRSIAMHGNADTRDWGWFEEGYDKEPTDPQGGPATHNSYITHHNAAQYFGYLSNNLEELKHFHGLADFYGAISARALSPDGGAYYIKGGYTNLLKLKPTDPDPAVQQNFLGDDDHPGYSDDQISEANIGQAINSIAKSPYWAQSAIVIVWDDSEGQYDHERPTIREGLPGVRLMSDGPRVPLMVVSPFARTGAISHEAGDHASVVKFIDTVFGLQPLGSLPDEASARALGYSEFGQTELGPYDGATPGIGNLLSAFDPDRLSGAKPPLPASYVLLPDRYVTQLPAQNGLGCNTVRIIPTDVAKGIQDFPPADFNPRPGTNPPAAKGTKPQNNRRFTKDMDD